MNTIYRLFTALTIMSVTLSVSAQRRIDKAINEFLLDKKSSEYVISNTKEQEFVTADGKNTLYNEIGFRIKHSDADILEKLRKAFLSESANAYNMMMRNANSGSNEQMKIAYGADLSKTFTFGTRSDRNYIVLNIKEPGDSTWRWCYALVWYESKDRISRSKDTYISGSISIIYSRDPKVKRSTSENVSVRTTILPDGTVVTYNSDNDTKTVVYKNSNVVGNGSTEYSDVDSPSRFRVIFGNLRSLFLDAKREKSGLAMQTTIANRMLDLCKNKGSLLSKDERSLCRTTLIDMSQGLNDKYVIGILKMAADALK